MRGVACQLAAGDMMQRMTRMQRVTRMRCCDNGSESCTHGYPVHVAGGEEVPADAVAFATVR